MKIKEIAGFPPKRVCTMYEGKELSFKEREMQGFNQAIDQIGNLEVGLSEEKVGEICHLWLNEALETNSITNGLATALCTSDVLEVRE